jgi:hypothetical protein
MKLYDTNNGFFIPNECKKYGVGENLGMKLNKDGGIYNFIAAPQPGVCQKRIGWRSIARTKALAPFLRINVSNLEKMKTWQALKAEVVKN